MAKIPTNQKDDVKDVRKKIAEHGLEEVEHIVDLPNGQTQTVTASRILIALEILYRKMVQSDNLGAAQQYLDRMLGKPKESLSITDDSEGIGKLTDDQLIKKILSISKAVRETGAGDTD